MGERMSGVLAPTDRAEWPLEHPPDPDRLVGRPKLETRLASQMRQKSG